LSVMRGLHFLKHAIRLQAASMKDIESVKLSD
jgi:hypothetical protein